MPLIIGAAPGSQWQNIIPVLEAVGWEHQSQVLELWYQNPETYIQANDYCLLLHSRPEYAIAYLLDAGHEPEQALKEWQHAVEKLLSFFKRNRRNTALADVADIMANPGGLLQWLKKTNTDFFEQAASHSAELYPLDIAEKPSYLSLIVAAQLVAQAKHLEPLLAQVEACSLPLVDNHYAAPDFNVSDAYRLLKQEIDTGKQSQEKEWTGVIRRQEEALGALGEENKLLLEQLLNIQNQLAETELDNKRLRAREEELSAVVVSLEAGVEQHKSQSAMDYAQKDEELSAQKQASGALQKKLDESIEENELLLKQLFSVQEELEKFYLKNQQQDTELQVFKSRMAEKEKALLEQIETKAKEISTLMAQLGKKDKELSDIKEVKQKSASELIAAKEENDLILKQLFMVQEELEKYYLKNNQLDNVVEEQKRQISEKNKKLKKLSNDRKQLKAVVDDYKRKEVRLNAAGPGAKSANYKGGGKVIRLLGLVKPSRRELYRHTKLVAKSDLFDAAWYLQRYPDVVNAFANPAEHYVKHGGLEGRDPGPNFSSARYMERYPDVGQAGINPLVHYLLYGKSEGRAI